MSFDRYLQNEVRKTLAYFTLQLEIMNMVSCRCRADENQLIC